MIPEDSTFENVDEWLAEITQRAAKAKARRELAQRVGTVAAVLTESEAISRRKDGRAVYGSGLENPWDFSAMRVQSRRKDIYFKAVAEKLDRAGRAVDAVP